MSESHFLSPEGTPSPEKIVPCQPAPRPIFPTAPIDDEEQTTYFPGILQSNPAKHRFSKNQGDCTGHVPYVSEEIGENKVTKNVTLSFGETNVDNLKRELQSSEAEISALRLALEAASEEIRLS